MTDIELLLSLGKEYWDEKYTSSMADDIWYKKLKGGYTVGNSILVIIVIVYNNGKHVPQHIYTMTGDLDG